MLESIHIDVFWHDLAQFSACMIHVRTYLLFFSPLISLPSVMHESMNPTFASKQHILQLHHQKKQNLICFSAWLERRCSIVPVHVAGFFRLSFWIIQQNIETYLSVARCKLHNHKAEPLNKSRSAARPGALQRNAATKCWLLWPLCSLFFFFKTGLKTQTAPKHTGVTSREEM